MSSSHTVQNIQDIYLAWYKWAGDTAIGLITTTPAKNLWITVQSYFQHFGKGLVLWTLWPPSNQQTFCLLVGLFVSRITQNQLNGIPWTCGMGHWRTHKMLVQIRIRVFSVFNIVVRFSTYSLISQGIISKKSGSFRDLMSVWNLVQLWIQGDYRALAEVWAWARKTPQKCKKNSKWDECSCTCNCMSK